MFLPLLLLGALVVPGTQGAKAPVVTYLPAAEVEAAFAKGAPLLEVGSYKIHASRRERSGSAEVHDRDTDVIHVLEGTALFVTGGTVVGGQVTATDELRGEAIIGGEERLLVPGDVIIVPAGVPHWFKTVEAPFLYYVVKVTSLEAS